MTQKVDCNELKNIMNNIEINTQNIIIAGIKTGNILAPNDVILNVDNNENNNKEKLNSSLELLNGIMKSGSDEFEKKLVDQCHILKCVLCSDNLLKLFLSII